MPVGCVNPVAPSKLPICSEIEFAHPTGRRLGKASGCSGDNRSGLQNAKALSTYMGHSSITVTLDRYGHLMPGSEREAASSLA